MNELDRLPHARIRSALGSCLHHALMLARRLDHAASLENIVRYRFFYIDILASLDGPDRSEGMPVVRRCDAHRLNRWILEQFADVFHPNGLASSLLFCSGLATPLTSLLITIADVRDYRARLAGKTTDMRLASSSSADHRNLNRIVGSNRSRWLWLYRTTARRRCSHGCSSC